MRLYVEFGLEVSLMIVRPTDVPEKKALGVTFKTLVTEQIVCVQLCTKR